MLNAILYVLRSGCQWRMLPKGLPPYSRVHGYFRQFWQLDIWTRIWAALLMDGREQAGKEASPSAAIVDSQSVKTMESRGIKGFDAGRKMPSGACWPFMGDRTHLAWLGRNRRLAKDFERLIETATAMLLVATVQLIVRRLASR